MNNAHGSVTLTGCSVSNDSALYGGGLLNRGGAEYKFEGKKYPSPIGVATLSGCIEDFPQVGDARKDGRQRLEDEIGAMRQKARERW